MKRFVIVVLLVIMPLPALAQAGKTVKRLGVVGLLGGAGLAVYGVVSGSETVAHYGPNPNCLTTGNVIVASVACSGTLTAAVAAVAPPARGETSVVAQTVTYSQERATNWKIAGPAIAASGTGALLAAAWGADSDLPEKKKP